MKTEQIRDYTALVLRRSEILLRSGKSWKPEYADELMEIDAELEKYRR